MLVDKGASINERLAAVRRLSGVSTVGPALDALIRISQDDSAPEALAQVAGAAVAKTLVRSGRLYDYDLRLAEFTAPAYISFDEAMRTLQQQTS
jgi:hypothetical protein